MAPEVRRGNYNYQSDHYSLGLIIWEVSQPIKANERNSLFDRLVNDKDETLVKLHSKLGCLSKLVIRLTKRKVEERVKHLKEEFVIGICHELDKLDDCYGELIDRFAKIKVKYACKLLRRRKQFYGLTQFGELHDIVNPFSNLASTRMQVVM